MRRTKHMQSPPPQAVAATPDATIPACLPDGRVDLEELGYGV